VLASAFIRAGLVDRCVAYVAPALLGAGPSAVGGLGVGSIEEIIRLPLVDVQQVGADVRLTLGGIPAKERS
jgi:diaminohydroxyphosphoribosylaminopyrimidine deaminase / 5-amino-6-(5-phosphoribosylamino)uracil reductase